MKISFKPLSKSFLPTLHQWFKQPHVKKWYARNKEYTLADIEEKYLPRIQNPKNIPNYIAYLNDEPIGYIQLYSLKEHLPDDVPDYEHSLFHQFKPHELIGLDVFFATEKYLGKGISSQVLQTFLNTYISTKIKTVVVDPLKSNKHAIQFFKRNQFELLSFEDSQEHTLMIKHLSKIDILLTQLKNDINNLLGFHDETPCINYGPCGVFAKLFFDCWNKFCDEKVHICFIMTLDNSECYHIAIRLPNGELYDGGIGIHSDALYPRKYQVNDMLEYDHKLLEKWAYGLDRAYPRFCPNFDKQKIAKLIEQTIKEIYF
ncbi:MAG: acetyltransferase [Gammaproteobacteria bacterium]|nr:acetyltransferase [Gammaproteobacteria bacterium]